MQEFFHNIKNNPLFSNVSQEDFSAMMNCLGGYTKKYNKKEAIHIFGDKIDTIGIIITGSVGIFQQDIFGNETILAKAYSGETFGEVFACADVLDIPVSVVSQDNSEILFLNYRKILTTCNKACVFHSAITENLVKIIATKCIFLNRKLEILSKRTMREKILAYLFFEGMGAKKIKSRFNREEMASFICVDRSALSYELSKMQRDGIIAYRKNEFEILI